MKLKQGIAQGEDQKCEVCGAPAVVKIFNLELVDSGVKDTVAWKVASPAKLVCADHASVEGEEA